MLSIVPQVQADKISIPWNTMRSSLPPQTGQVKSGANAKPVNRKDRGTIAVNGNTVTVDVKNGNQVIKMSAERKTEAQKKIIEARNRKKKAEREIKATKGALVEGQSVEIPIKKLGRTDVVSYKPLKGKKAWSRKQTSRGLGCYLGTTTYNLNFGQYHDNEYDNNFVTEKLLSLADSPEFTYLIDDDYNVTGLQVMPSYFCGFRYDTEIDPSTGDPEQTPFYPCYGSWAHNGVVQIDGMSSATKVRYEMLIEAVDRSYDSYGFEVTTPRNAFQGFRIRENAGRFSSAHVKVVATTTAESFNIPEAASFDDYKRYYHVSVEPYLDGAMVDSSSPNQDLARIYFDFMGFDFNKAATAGYIIRAVRIVVDCE